MTTHRAEATSSITQVCPMGTADLPRVMAIEMCSYSHPWTVGNFTDSLNSGYWCRTLLADAELLGYVVAMQGVGEAHLLNLTIAPGHRQRGHARQLLDALASWARSTQLPSVWLEVRASNEVAQTLYKNYGFSPVGRRANYYPGGPAAGLPLAREDAIVMSYMP
jgi:[ribosomal protein S18]-alanine N-acetyltransferase